ncbi:class I SAM-dependent methyltransferase [Hahella aquimaris]|uniref:class I SAM-dependent methyltransferase n=1 Tax=Hahella sp. HNIBRBA332 TaxID=3015983 RepID=UPI00273C81AC|nr:class I SAM-dependent methyltransferase [Hahella sp. HNIBRBA332]WLQ16453.1 class I SAM-dependent methyltransferase [Hahella sp. HNIBRBA332]
MTNAGDKWDAAASYEAFMGRWSRRIAVEYLSWLNAPPGLHWLDVGCGTGALTRAICDVAQPASVIGCDPAEPFIAFAREQALDLPASFIAAGVGSLPRHPGGFDCVTSMFALNFFPNAEAALHEMQTAAAPGAIVSACVWDYAQGMEFLRYFWDAATAQDPAAKELDESPRFPLCHPDKLTQLFSQTGFHGIQCEPVEIPTLFTHFDDYWLPFLGATGPAPTYIDSLSADLRNAIADTLRKTLPIQPDGTIPLKAKAWAIRGVVHRAR